MRVAFVASDVEGGGRVRSFWPAMALRQAGVDVPYCGVSWPSPGSVDVLVVHRPTAMDSYERILEQKRAGTKVVVDEDDDLAAARTLPLFRNRPGWKQLVRAHDAAIRVADALCVATGRLAKVYANLNPTIRIVRNRLPASVGAWSWLNTNPGAPVVGWTGVLDTHLADMLWLAPEADRAFAGARFSTIGDADTPKALGLRTTPYQTLDFQFDAPSFYKLMSKADIGIVPLARNDLNLAKSWLKALEYMTLGIPVVARRLPEQALLIGDGGTVGFLADTPKEFARCVQELVHDEPLRRKMGEAARAEAVGMQLESNLDEWFALFSALT